MRKVLLRYLGFQKPHILTLDFLRKPIRFEGKGKSVIVDQADAIKLISIAPFTYKIVRYVEEEELQNDRKPVLKSTIKKKEKPPLVVDDGYVFAEDEEVSSSNTLTRREQIARLQMRLKELGVKLPRGMQSVKKLTKLLKDAEKELELK